MYRQYENPTELENALAEWLENHPKETWDEYDYETYGDLKDRINFAWQDDEYDEMLCYGLLCDAYADDDMFC